MKDNWGYTISVDVKACVGLLECFIDEPAHREKARTTLTKFCKHLVDEIEMIAYKQPLFEVFGEGNARGFTCVQLLTTSALVMHFCDDSRDIYVDLTSCKRFKPEKVIDCFERWFQPENCRYNFFNRNTKLSE